MQDSNAQNGTDASDPAGCSGHSAPDERAIARRLCDTLARAMDMGQWDHADRVAATAVRMAARHTRLIEQLARLRLAENRPSEAIDLIESSHSRSASLRLLHNVCLVLVGRTSEAHMDVNDWARHATAPLACRLLLAMLEAEAGDLDSATAALVRNLRHFDDPRSLAVLVLLSAERRRPDLVRLWTRRLQEACMFGSREFGIMLSSLGESVPDSELSPTDAHVAHLAMELVAHEDVIPALISSQRISLEPRTAELLSRAIERALPDLQDQRAGHEALAALSVLLDNRAAARAWAQRGLEINPFAVSLAHYLAPADSASAEALPSRSSRAAVLATIGARVHQIDESPRDESYLEKAA